VAHAARLWILTLALVAGLLLLAGTFRPAWAGAALPLLLLASLAFWGLALAFRGPALWRLTRSPLRMGAWVEARLPAWRTDLRTWLELRDRPVAPESAPLRQALGARLAHQLGRDHGPALAVAGHRWPGQRWLPALGRASVTVWLVVLVLAVVQPAALRTALGAMLRGAVPAALQPDTAPDAGMPVRLVVAFVDLDLLPPAWSGRPPRRQERSSGMVHALPGTEVVWEAATLVPVRGGLLVLGPLDAPLAEIPLQAQGDQRVRARFTVDQAVPMRVVLEELDGTRVLDPVPRAITLEPDLTPTVELLLPPASMEVQPDEVIGLEYLVSDDFGVQQVELVWYFGGQEDQLRTLRLQDAVGTSFREHVPFELAPLMLQPGEEVVVFVEALDNHGHTGPQVGRSRAVSLSVASPDALHAEVLARKEALLEALLVRLAEHLVVRWSDWEVVEDTLVPRPPERTAPERTAAALATLGHREGWLRIRQAFEELERMMTEDVLSTDQDRTLFAGMARTLEDRARALLEPLERWEFRLQEAVEAAPEPEAAAAAIPDDTFGTWSVAGAALEQDLERTLVTLQGLIDLHQAEDVQRTLEELSEIRDNLRGLMERFRNARDPELRDQIERELRRLEQRMQELLQRLASQVQNLPREHLNAEGLEPSEVAREAQNMMSAMDQIRQMLQNGDIESALQALDQLGQSLDEMQSQMGGVQEQASQSGLSEFDQAMGELMDAINDLEVAEQALEAQTQALDQAMREERTEAMREEVAARMDAARQQVDTLRRRMERQPTDGLQSEARQRWEDLTQGLERLSDSLGQRDVPTVQDQAARMAMAFEELTQDTERDARWAPRDSARRAQAEQASQLSRQGRELMEQMRGQADRIMEQGEPVPGPGDRQRMAELGEQQAEVEARLQQLQQRMEQMGQRLPSVPSSFGEAMDQAGEGMQQARRQLQQGTPRPAMQGQRQALDALGQMRQQAQQMARRERGRQQGEGGQRGARQERVEIPEDDADRSRGLRDAVREGMREGGLESFDARIRRYYDSLMR
jgi:hypothetical protein